MDKAVIQKAGERFLKVVGYILASEGVLVAINALLDAELDENWARLINALLAALAVFLIARYPRAKRVL